MYQTQAITYEKSAMRIPRHDGLLFNHILVYLSFDVIIHIHEILIDLTSSVIFASPLIVCLIALLATAKFTISIGS